MSKEIHIHALEKKIEFIIGRSMLDMINDFFQVGKNAFHVKCEKN